MLRQSPEEFQIPKPVSNKVKSPLTLVIEGLEYGQDYLWDGKRRQATSICYLVGKRLGRRFRCRTEASGVRIYRTL